MKKGVILFEVIMFFLVIISLFLAFSNNSQLVKVDWVIWLIFVIDYFVRFIRADNKWSYIKQHPLELIAIIPFDSIFRAARIVRVFRIMRLIGIGSRYTKTLYIVLKTNGLDKVLLLAIVLLFLIPIPIVLIEPSINTFTNALWWAVVTTTTVGYGDISPETPIGRGLAIILMLLGIGIIGTFTSAITSFFSTNRTGSRDSEIDYIAKKIDELEDIDQENVDLLHAHIKRKFSSSESSSSNR